MLYVNFATICAIRGDCYNVCCTWTLLQCVSYVNFATVCVLYIRAGLQSQKWSDQQITLNPTGSIHKKARKKKFDPKKVDFD